MESIDPLPSSWSTCKDEMARGAPYQSWLDPSNELHKLQWQLTNLAIDAISSMQNDGAQFRHARKLLDQGLHSCQYWGASCRPEWDTDMIERGARMLVECIKTVKEKLPNDMLDQAQELYSAIKNKTLQWQYSGEVDKLRAAYIISHPRPAVGQASVPK